MDWAAERWGKVKVFSRGNRRLLSKKQRLLLYWQAIQGFARTWGKPILIAAVCGLAVWGGFSAYLRLKTSKYFVLRHVTVDGVGDASVEEVLRSCGLKLGEGNLLFMNAEQIAERCLGDPRWRHVAVEIELPDRLIVRIEENDTAMYVATLEGLWNVNRFGEAWAPADPQDLRPVPLLVGAERAILDHDSAQRVIRDALSLVRIVMRSCGPFQWQGLIVSYDEVLGYTLSDSSSGFTARFGFPPFLKKCERLTRAIEEAQKQGLSVELALLDNEIDPKVVTLRLSSKAGSAPTVASSLAGEEQ